MKERLVMATCNGCGAEITWIKTEAGKNAPIDAKPIKAYVALNPEALCEVEYILMDVHLSHFATCPRANDLRRG
jgi:hypothetical protein